MQLRTSGVPGGPRSTGRDGYRVERVGSHISGVPRAAVAGLLRRLPRADAVVEVWNGIPFATPLWWRGPRLVLLHHLHDRLWPSVLPGPLARVGSIFERRVAPYAYRSSPISTLSASSKDEIVARTPLPADVVRVNSVGVEDRFCPDGARHSRPTVLVVARLTEAKRVDVVIDAMTSVVAKIPDARLVVVGDGPARPALVAQVSRLGLRGHVELLREVGPDELLDHYRSAWVLASASESEGWGMSVTEAGACGTPSVVSDIVGHRDSVPDGAGLRVPVVGFGPALARMLTDDDLRNATGQRALEFARTLSWDRVAAGLLGMLLDDARRRR